MIAITRKELQEKIQKVMVTTPHSAKEWEEAYMDLNIEADRFWALEERLEQAIEIKYGKDELLKLCNLASQLFFKGDEYQQDTTEIEITEEDKALFDEILGLTEDDVLLD